MKASLGGQVCRAVLVLALSKFEFVINIKAARDLARPSLAAAAQRGR